MKRSGFVALCVVLSACTAVPVGGRKGIKAVADDATHCRISSPESNKKQWRIKKVSDISEFLPWGDNYFDIIQRWGYSSSEYDIVIRTDHEIRIYSNGDGTVRLEHTKNGEYRGESKIMRLENDLWLIGDAYKGIDTVGKYVVFMRAEDQENCRHDGKKTGTCKTIHIEYFDSDDFSHDGDLPDTDKNVKEISVEPCDGGIMETNEGDGDEGPDTP